MPLARTLRKQIELQLAGKAYQPTLLHPDGYDSTSRVEDSYYFFFLNETDSEDVDMEFDFDTDSDSTSGSESSIA